ncbi:unnamed protein product [Effrenium voratum]|nr:unnamed protein product [Effrenium voratum]
MAAMLQSRLGLPRLVHLSASPGCCKEPLAPLARGAWTTSSPALLRAAFFALTLRRAGSGSTPRRAFAAGPATAEAAEAEAEADAEAAGQGLLLVVGCSPDLAELCVPQRRFRRVLRAPPLRSPQEVEDLMALAHAEHPELEIQGLLHGGPSASSSSSSLTSPGAAEALDASLRSLALLAPVLEKLPHARLVSWSSDLGFASPASWAPQGAGMAALACNFMEQYIQALAHQMRKSGVTVYGMRFTEEAVRISLDSDQNARHQLEKEIQEVWSLPRREAHGQIFEVGRPLVSFSTQSARGGSVLGSSLDVQWALRSAVKDAASYPVDGRPATYKALADALRTAPERLVWAHGASDVILRTALAAAKRGTGDRALMQSPSWPNAASLLRAGGLKVDTVPYPDPSEGAEGGDSWELLRERLDVPPALVYLVHPHFPTGVKDPHFAESLQELLAAGAFQRSLVAVDQTYLGFTELTTDDELLESLAEEYDNVVLIRSLSKVEGLAALRLGYAKSTVRTVQQITETLPFYGGLYVSEMALSGALAAISGPVAVEHRQQVLDFYAAEQQWLREQLEALGFKTSAASAPFFPLRGPGAALRKAAEGGAALQCFSFGEEDAQRTPAVCLVADRASNHSTIRMLKEALETTNPPGWAEMLRPMLGG